jgi:Ras-related GTP-binding protein C/D
MEPYEEPDDDRYIIGSFPKGFTGYEENDGDIHGNDAMERAVPSEQKPRILIMGLRRSGKSSIQKVVFHKMSPNETLFLESTNKIVKDDISNSSFVSFQIWDFPGQIDFFDQTFDSEEIFGTCGALVFVIDAQVCYNQYIYKIRKI